MRLLNFSVNDKSNKTGPSVIEMKSKEGGCFVTFKKTKYRGPLQGTDKSLLHAGTKHKSNSSV